MKKICFLFMCALLCISSAFSRQMVSQRCSELIADYYALRLYMTQVTSHEEGLMHLASYEKNVQKEMEEHALNYEVEHTLLLNLSGIEYYTLMFDDESFRGELDEMMRLRSMKGLEVIDSLDKKDGGHPMLYTAVAETLSRYMFSSVSAVLKYGFKSKKLWEKSLALDENNVLALVDLGQWYYFAPFFFGGSSRKAKKLFEKAWEYARSDGEKYYAALYLSQFYFEKKRYKDCEELMAVAEKICPDSMELKTTRYQNSQKRSLLKYNRDRSKLDEQRKNMSDEDLKKGAVQ